MSDDTPPSPPQPKKKKEVQPPPKKAASPRLATMTKSAFDGNILTPTFQVGDMQTFRVAISVQDLVRLINALPISMVESPDDMEGLQDGISVLESIAKTLEKP